MATLPSAGPLDRAALGWLLVVPILLLAPGVAGITAGDLDRPSRIRVAASIGLLAALATTMLMATAIRQLGCEPVETFAEALPAAVILGLVAGIGLAAASGVSAEVFARFRAWRATTAIVSGAAVALAGGGVWILTLAIVMPPVTCPVPV